MLGQSVISPATVPTEWCSGIVPVPNGRVRICVDLTPLGKAVKREIHPMGSVDESLAMPRESRVFWKLDANNGFWQIPLDEDSKLLSNNNNNDNNNKRSWSQDYRQIVPTRTRDCDAQ